MCLFTSFLNAGQMLTTNRCRGRCVRSECARDGSPSGHNMLMQLAHVDPDHVSACFYHELRRAMANNLSGTRWTSLRPGCEPPFRRPPRVPLTLYRQLQTGKATGEDAYSGMLDCFRKIVRNEG